jgi:hypothetical protein
VYKTSPAAEKSWTKVVTVRATAVNKAIFIAGFELGNGRPKGEIHIVSVRVDASKI